MNDRDPLLRDLVANDAWIRALANRLVADSHAAEDVAQQVWVDALSKCPDRLPRMQAWLRTVVRNAASMRGRTEERRRRREQAVARRERVPSAAEIRERVETRHRIATAVFALEEPYRSTILQRYFEGLPPREIATAAGVSSAAVEGRLRRGIAMLRARLDSDFGDRSQWSAALFPIAGGAAIDGAAAQTTLTTLGVGVMSSTAKLGLATAAVLLVGAFVLWPKPTAVPPPPAEPRAADADDEIVGSPETATVAASNVKESLSGAVAAPEAAARRTVEPRPVRGGIVGFVCDTDGRPIRDAVVRALDAGAGRVEPPCVRETRTDLHGAYRLAPLEERCILDVSAPGYYSVRRLAHPFSRQDAVLGEPGRLAGHVRSAGKTLEPCIGATVSLYRRRASDVLESVVWQWWHSLLRHPMAAVRTDAGGGYRFDGLQPGAYSIRVSHPDHPSRVCREAPVRIVAAREVKRDLLLGDGLVIDGRVEDATSGAPIANAQVEFWSHPRKHTTTDSDGRFRVRGLDWEVHEQVRIRASGYMPASFFVQHHEFGSTLHKTITLRRGISVHGRVVGPRGKPIAGARIGTHRTVADDCLARDLGSDTLGVTDETGAFDVAVLPSLREVRLHAAAPHRARGVSDPIPIRGTRGAEDIVIRLPEGGAIEGCARDESGEPIPGCTVLVHGEYRIHRRGMTRQDGRYEIVGVSAGCYLLEVRPPAGENAVVALARERVAGVVVTDGSRAECNVTLRRGATVAGRVVATTGESLEGVAVRATVPDSRNLLFAEPCVHVGVTGADGRFEITGLDSVGARYTLLAGRSGFWKARVREVAAGRSDVTITLERAATLEGRVLAASTGKPQTAFKIDVVRSSKTGYRGPLAPQHTGGRLTFADLDGRFSIELRPGTFEVSAQTSDGRRSDPVTVAVGEASPLPPVRLVVWDGAALSGTISATERFHHATVGVWDVSSQPPKSVRFDRVDRSGRFEMGALPAGDYLVEAFAPGRWLAAVAPVSLVVGTVRELDLRLRPCAKLYVTASDSRGNAVTNATVSIHRSDGLAVASKVSHAALHDRLLKARIRAGTMPDAKSSTAITQDVKRRLTRTDERGRVAPWLLVRGEYAVRVSAPGFETASETIVVRGPADRTVSITLHRRE